MESTTYGGSEKTPEIDRIGVERPLTASIIDEILGVARIRGITGNARMLYLVYWVMGDKGDHKASLRATANDLNMPFETFRRVRQELISVGLFEVFESLGAYAITHTRVIVRDYKTVTQNESGRLKMSQAAEVTQNESDPHVEVKRTDPHRPPRALQSSLVSSSLPVVGTDIQRRIVPSRLNDNATTRSVTHVGSDIEDSVFDLPPQPSSGHSRVRRFKLKPPPGPSDAPPPPRRVKRVKGSIPYTVYKAMYKICYGIADARQEKTLTRDQRVRIASVLQRLDDAGADLSRIYEFGTWVNSWAKYRPSPEKVQEWWWRAMAEIDGVVDERYDKVNPIPERAELGQDAIAAAMKRRAKEYGNPNV